MSVDLCHGNGPPGRLRDWVFVWDEKHLGIPEDFELRGMARQRLMRLRPDFRDEGCWTPKSRVEFMTLVGREALIDGNCEVVGGFIRDWVIRGKIDEVNDIDIRMWMAFDIPLYIARCCALWDLELVSWKNRTIRFKTPYDDEFEVDYVIEDDKHADPPKSVDLDVNSLAVSTDRGLHKREYQNRPICKTIGNIRRKSAYLIANDPADASECVYMQNRVKKMKNRGWEIIRADSLYRNCVCKK